MAAIMMNFKTELSNLGFSIAKFGELFLLVFSDICYYTQSAEELKFY